jgi:hypothetical protein
MKNTKYVITYLLMIILVSGMYFFYENSIGEINKEINKIEGILDEKDSRTKTKNLSNKKSDSITINNPSTRNFNEKLIENKINMEELIIDKYIDYSSFLVAGISVIMTVMILFTFRDFERLDHLKEQSIESINKVNDKLREFDGKITNLDNYIVKQKEVIEKEFNNKSNELKTQFESNKIANEILTQKIANNDKVFDDFLDLYVQIGMMRFADVFLQKKVISNDDYNGLKLLSSKIAIMSNTSSVKIRAILNIRNSGTHKDASFLEEKLNQEKDENIRKVLIDAMTDLLKK